MGRIDQATVQKILDSADIVEVVSDFVHLKRRGSGFIGLCPFHNERTPSFSVSKSKGICKCFSCGKGGSPINFIMEIEQIGYQEALRYLARKYNIQIEERELSREEQEEASQREAMFSINDFAMKHFEENLRNSQSGRDIGLAYFRERGINDQMIERFHLGYSLEGRTELYDVAISKGYQEEYLLSTGLCYRGEQDGKIRDRFRGRVMYPVHTLSGKVVAFGGRTLKKDKDVAKYVNSPESAIYHKSRELYGLYQAKRAIVKKDKCILVEGYMDVISMHQSGVENVVASSGTSLTEGQIRLIHRFTDNVTVIYDSDAAGIKASLRGIDMLLTEGLNIKVLLLPEGDDPDSFAQSHSSSEVEDYIQSHETDFIRFKTDILLKEAGNDPIARARVISDIVMSISVIPDDITRNVYISECSHSFGIDEGVIRLQIAKYVAERAERQRLDAQRRKNREDAGLPPEPGDGLSDQVNNVPLGGNSQEVIPTVAKPGNNASDTNIQASLIRRNAKAKAFRQCECDLLKYIIRYGMVNFCEVVYDDFGNTRPMTVIEYVTQELEMDDIEFVNSDYLMAYEAAKIVARTPIGSLLKKYIEEIVEPEVERVYQQGLERIREQAKDLPTIERLEKELSEEIELLRNSAEVDFRSGFIVKRLASDPDNTIRRVATELMSDRHRLSRIYEKYGVIKTERDTLGEGVPRAVYALKNTLILYEIKEITMEIQQAYKVSPPDLDLVRSLMNRQSSLQEIKKELSRYLGDRVVTPFR